MKKGILLNLFIIISTHLYGQQNIYEIFAIECAPWDWRPTAKDIAIGASTNDTMSSNMVVWLLRGDNGKIVLVDAALTDTVQWPTQGYISPNVAIQKIGIQPGDITDLIITHPHFDHIGGIDLFPNAMLWMQHEDFNHFVGDIWQKEGATYGFNKQDVLKLIQKNLDGKLNLIKGDSLEIIPGIRVFIGSKHTFESQYVLVHGTSGNTIIASDNIWFYYNLEHLLPIPHTLDPIAYVNAMKRMKTLVSDIDLIIPGHDATVFTKFPKVTDGVVKIVLSKN